MADPVVTCLSLCSGAAGIELGLRLVIPGLRTVGFAEWESYAATCLLARMEDEALEPAPVWCGDLAGMDASPFLGVDLVTAGFPCQPWSSAGQRQGTEDARWIWPDVAAIIRQVGPRLVFLENVPGFLAGGLGHVLADLASLGFDAEWCVLSAADVGAPHLRKRVFVLAYRHGDGLGLERQQARIGPRDADGPGRAPVANSNGDTLWQQPVRKPRSRRAAIAEHDGPDGLVADAGGPWNGAQRGSEHCPPSADGAEGLQRVECGGEAMADALGGRHDGRARNEGRGAVGRAAAERAGGELADASEPGRERQGLRGRVAERGAELADTDGGSGAAGQRPDTGPGTGAVARWDGCELPLWPAGPDDADGWRRVIEQRPDLAPSVPKPEVRRLADELPAGVDGRLSPYRLDELRCLGNAVSPACAAAAWLILAGRAGLTP